MPPTRDQFKKRFGDTILGDYDEDEDDDDKSDNSTSKNDEEPPKPTADVMMSRNLKGGAAKNFNFAFSSDGEDESQESPQKRDSPDGESAPVSGFGLKPINLLTMAKAPGFGKTGIKNNFIKPLITTNEDKLGSLFI
jgi:hypothetical protein